jgi:hypothetical protein
LGSQARRVRRLDELSKRVSFWDNWTKVVGSTVSPDPRADARVEIVLSTLAREARRELSRAAEDAILLYRPKVDQIYAKYPLTIQEFQIYRSRLPRYRRALLLYKAPHPAAAIRRAFFYIYLAVPLVEFPALKVLDHFRPPNTNPHPTLVAFAATHLTVAVFLIFGLTILTLGVTPAFYLLVRKQVIRVENDPEYYLWVEDRETGHKSPR